MLSLSSLHHLALSLVLPPVLYLCFNLFSLHTFYLYLSSLL